MDRDLAAAARFADPHAIRQPSILLPMNPQFLDQAAAARSAEASASALDQLSALQETAKGALMYGLSGLPVSITTTQVVFVLPVTISEERTKEDYLQACDELMAEKAFDYYSFLTYTTRARLPYGDGDIADCCNFLDTPLVVAVRNRSACSTRVGPAAG